jgi:xanthine dehydrogenase molybdenum-binding subunit
MLHGALVLSAHPRARVRAIDTQKARAAEGVIAVITAADVPGKRFQGLIYPDWPIFVAPGEETRYTGDVICAVAAETRAQARRAAALVEVDYEVLVPVTSPAQALEKGAPLLHPENGHADNVLSVSKMSRGDAGRALAESAHVVEGTWSTQFIEHAFLEPESCLAVPPGAADLDGEKAPRLHVYSQGQGVYDDQRQIASALGLAPEALRVTLVSCGGAFGGKEDLSIQAQTALLAVVTRRPVKLTIDRVESIRLHPKRHPIEMRYTVGCDAEGRLTAVKVRLTGDKGAYASVGSKVIERACGHATGAYDVPHVDVEGVAVYTNNPPCGAMRGFGANQSGFAMESALDMLADKVGLDPWEMRWRNALAEGKKFCTGQTLRAVGLQKTLEAVKPRYDEARAQGRAVGLACGIKNVGIGNGMPDIGRASLTVEPDGTITLSNGYTEMGQGLYTVLIQMASETAGIDPRRFRAVVDTADGVPSGMTTASRATVCGGRAVVDAAQKLKADLDAAGGDLARLAGRRYLGEFIYDKTSKLGAKVDDPITHLSFGYATQLAILDENGRLERLVAAHDVGRVINPTLLSGQLEGSIHMGLGFALSEELIVENGEIQNPTLRGLGVLRAQHMPALEILFVEEPEPEGPFGAKGVGEIGLLPTAPAVANALYRFDGIRRHALPMKDSPAGRAIVGQKERRT